MSINISMFIGPIVSFKDRLFQYARQLSETYTVHIGMDLLTYRIDKTFIKETFMKISSIILSTFILCQSVGAFAKSVDYKISKNTYEGFMINKGKKAPLVIIVHDWDGLDGYEVKRSEMLAKLGYSVFALDMFGKGIRPAEVAERKKLTGELYKDRNKMRRLMDGALKAAKDNGLNTQNAVVVGYCFGGTSILEWAKSGVDLKGFASFHGDLTVNDGDSYQKTKAKIAVYHGTADEAVSMQSFADLAVLLEKEKISHEMMTYSGAPHAFTKFGTERYRKEADQKSWKHFVGFLAEQLK